MASGVANVKDANVKFFVDEDTLGLAHLLTKIRPDVTFPGDPGGVTFKRQRPPCEIVRGTKDVDWIPDVANKGWLVLTRDKNISKRTAEKKAVETAGAKLVAVTTSEDLSTFGILEVVMCQWRKIDEIAQLPGPFIYGATRATFTKLDSFNT